MVKAIRIHKTGGPEVLQLAEAPAPPPLRAYPDEPLLRAPSRSADDGQDADEPIIITDHVAPPAPQQKDLSP